MKITYELPNGREIHIVKMSKGYFLEGHFMTPFACLKALINAGIIKKHEFPNGVYHYGEHVFSSAKKLYFAFRDDFDMSYDDFRKCYFRHGVAFEESYANGYTYENDASQKMYFDYEELLDHIVDDWYTTGQLWKADELEKEYICGLNGVWEVEDYLELSINKRIKILEDFASGKR